jgi:5'-deoxynucleotidase YfbR-like HD superfamily hydrolase
MMSDRKGNWFLTASGRKFWPLDPRPEDFSIEDIAHGLSNISRFGGHCRTFYSVAQHSLMVMNHTPEPFKRVALMHDAPEAYVGDMVRPLKYSMPQYMEAEAKVWRAIAARFDLPLEIPKEVKLADDRALMTEKRDLLPSTFNFDMVHAAPFDEQVDDIPPGVAKTLFLLRFQSLFSE